MSCVYNILSHYSSVTFYVPSSDQFVFFTADIADSDGKIFTETNTTLELTGRLFLQTFFPIVMGWLHSMYFSDDWMLVNVLPVSISQRWGFFCRQKLQCNLAPFLLFLHMIAHLTWYPQARRQSKRMVIIGKQKSFWFLSFKWANRSLGCRKINSPHGY